MRVLQIFLLVFIPSLAFSFIPNSLGGVPDNLAPIRLTLLLTLCTIGGLWALWNASQGQSLTNYLKLHKKNTLIMLIFGYAAWVIVASVLSPISGYAFMGMSVLQFGSVFLVLCYLAALIFSSTSSTIWIIRSLALATIVMFIWTSVEAIGVKPVSVWLHSAMMQYPAASIGDRRHLAGWFAIMSLAPLFFYRARPRDLWFWLWIISALAGIGLTTTTAATIGVGLGLLAWLASSFRTASWKMPALILLIFGAFVLSLPSAASTTAMAFGLKPPQLKDYGSTASFKPRLYLWKAAWNSTLKHPFFGQGDETFAYQVFENLSPADAKNLFRAELGLSANAKINYGGFTYYADDPVKNTHTAGSLIYVRAHSIIFDELYSHGFPGLILLTALVIALLRHVYRRERSAFPLFVVAALPYPVYLLAWFYVPTVTPLFFIMIGTMLADLQRPLPTPQEALHAPHTGLYAD